MNLPSFHVIAEETVIHAAARIKKLPPPVIFGILVVPHLYLGLVCGMIAPFPWTIPSLLFLTSGGLLGFLSILKFHREGISPLPWTPNTVALFTHGIYGLSRNPMYLSLIFGLLGIGITMGPLLLLITLPLLIHFLSHVIDGEEKMNGLIFKKLFAEYCSKTRRWL